jgi:hypothetical protein
MTYSEKILSPAERSSHTGIQEKPNDSIYQDRQERADALIKEEAAKAAKAAKKAEENKNS